jgi:uncharacterized membrane protein YoaK (UPF0700 family)
VDRERTLGISSTVMMHQQRHLQSVWYIATFLLARMCCDVTHAAISSSSSSSSSSASSFTTVRGIAVLIPRGGSSSGSSGSSGSIPNYNNSDDSQVVIDNSSSSSSKTGLSSSSSSSSTTIPADVPATTTAASSTVLSTSPTIATSTTATIPSVTNAAATYSNNNIDQTSSTTAITTTTILQKIQSYIPDNAVYTLSQNQATIIGMMLAMNSGYLNGLSLSGFTTVATSTTKKLAVAAVTGAYTNVALQLAQRNGAAFLIPLRFIFTYMIGSMFTGFINHHHPKTSVTPYEIHTYSVGITLYIATIYLLMASILLRRSSGGGDVSMSVYYLLTLVNGIQNSLSSIYTSNRIRSTHYSGMTSDTGTFLGQYIASRYNRSDLLPKIYSNILLAVSFIVGGILSYLVVQQGSSTDKGYTLFPSIVLYLTLTGLSFFWKPTAAATAQLQN